MLMDYFKSPLNWERDRSAAVCPYLDAFTVMSERLSTLPRSDWHP